MSFLEDVDEFMDELIYSAEKGWKYLKRAMKLRDDIAAEQVRQAALQKKRDQPPPMKNVTPPNKAPKRLDTKTVDAKYRVVK